MCELNFWFIVNFSRLVGAGGKVDLSFKFISEKYSSMTTTLSQKDLSILFGELSGFVFVSVLSKFRSNGVFK